MSLQFILCPLCQHLPCPLNQFHSTYEWKKVLISGGLGFIGSNLADRLVGDGAQVTIVDSMIPEYGGNMRNIHGISDKITVNFSDGATRSP